MTHAQAGAEWIEMIKTWEFNNAINQNSKILTNKYGVK